MQVVGGLDAGENTVHRGAFALSVCNWRSLDPKWRVYRRADGGFARLFRVFQTGIRA
jgi:hypothetical protein